MLVIGAAAFALGAAQCGEQPPASAKPAPEASGVVTAAASPGQAAQPPAPTLSPVPPTPAPRPTAAPFPTPTPEPKTHVLRLEIYLEPEVAAVIDPSGLTDAIAAAIEAALGTDVATEVHSLDAALTDRLELATAEIADEVGLGEAQKAYDEVANREAESAADEDRLFADLQAAAQALDAADAALRTALEERGALVDVPADRVAIEIAGADRYVAIRPRVERWARVSAGAVVKLYPEDAARRLQSLANQTVQALGLLAGLDLREGEPGEAMTGVFDFDADDHLVRDEAPVTFTPRERDLVREQLVSPIEAAA